MLTIVSSFLNFVSLPWYNNLLKSCHQKVDTIKKYLCFGKGGLVNCISRFICPIKPIRNNDPNRPNYHKPENLVLIAEAENMIRINNGVINVYMFWHEYFEGVEFYATIRYLRYTKEGREEDLFLNKEEEEDDEFLSVSELPLLVEQRLGGVEFLDLTCLASGKILNLTSDYMADI